MQLDLQWVGRSAAAKFHRLFGGRRVRRRLAQPLQDTVAGPGRRVAFALGTGPRKERLDTPQLLDEILFVAIHLPLPS